jgi:hypothetical protein
MAKLTQEQLLEIFHALKKELKPYEKGTIKALFDMEGKYDLWSVKKVMAHGKMRDEVSFAALIVQSTYVGFYFMPIYSNPEEMKTILSPELLKCLKGKACFHIKKADADVLKQVKAAMKAGYEQYKKNDWV